MKLIPSGTTIVLTGAWNTSIIAPKWLAKEVFKTPPGTEVLVEFPTIPGPPPRYTIDAIKVVPTSDKLIISPEQSNDEALVSAENKARAILETLPHTPLHAFGENFRFEDDAPTPDLLRIFDIVDTIPEKLEKPVDVISTSVSTSFQIESRQLNLKRTLNNGKIQFEFNFHYPVTSAQEAIGSINDSFVTNFRLAVEVIRSVYDSGFEPQLIN